LAAGLTLLIAGFIARRTIQKLVRDEGRSPAYADTGAQPGLVGGGEKLHPPADIPRYAGGGERAAGGQRKPSQARNDSPDGGEKNRSGEHITGAETRRLDDLIKEKSR
jgi:hypothetical protein